ncbi:FAD-dependent monooxygenase [Nocardioides sp. CN2-186]|uniref:FAD-dependent monooxygenase n=1 Tax=Nocardioides tweenelious TaxID=3156607 RepID=UPI0032B5A6EE
MDTRPVVVIGNGPVGQTTALLLARWGVPVLLLDALTRRELVGSRSICQQREALDVWASVGGGHRIADEGVTWRVARTYFREHELFALTFADPGRSPFPPWVNIGQARVEALLDERIAEAPEIEVRWGHRVTGLTQGEDGVELAVETPDGPARIATPYVVACAGAHADGIRGALGLDFAGTSFDDRFLICDIRTDLPDRELERRFHFDPEWNPGRQVLIHPCPDSVYRIDWQVPADFDLAAEETSGALDERIRAVVGDRPYEVVWRTVYRFHARRASRMRAGRVLLAGDCAHLMAPFGARGLNSGVADADNAAWRIAFALHGWGEGERLLEGYDTERRAAAAENLAVTTRTMDFLVPQTAEGRAHRLDVLERAVTDPEARAEIDSGRLYAPVRYGADAHPAVGAILPDHPVGDSRLRELARRGLLLLATDPVEPPETDLPLTTLVLPPDLADELGVRPGEVWVVRPDAYVAAVMSRDGVVRAIEQLLRGR